MNEHPNVNGLKKKKKNKKKKKQVILSNED